MILHEQIVVVEPAEGYEEHLAFQSERGAGTDEPCDDLELRSERIAGREQRSQCIRTQRVIDDAFEFHGTARDDGVLVLKHMRAVARDDGAERIAQYAIEGVDADRPAGTDLILQGLAA